MNRQPYQTPPKIWPHRMTPWLVRLWGPMRRRTLLRKQRMVRLDVQNAEPVRQLLADGAGVLLTPNHSFHYDSYVLMEAARQLGRPVHFMTAWQVFAMSGWFESWMLQRHGCFSIDRESNDMGAFRTTVEILNNSPSPLVIFPEGDIYHINDRVMPFREGAAAMAMSAARKGTRKIVCVPVALKCWYVQDPLPELGKLMTRLEDHFMMRPRPDLSFTERVYRFGGVALSIKELDYLGASRSGLLPERIAHLAEQIVAGLEKRYNLSPKGHPMPERVKEVRRNIIRKQEKEDLSLEERGNLAGEMEDLFFVVQLFSYPGNYVAEKPTIERLAETLDKFEEDVFRVSLPGVRGARRVVVRFGDPIEVSKEREGRDAVTRFTDLLETKVQTLLDQINATAAPAAGGAPAH
jgi:1-acyl-sn-glycerol-3-phosphate acyltransferase